RVGVRRRQACIATAPRNLQGGTPHRRFLVTQIRLLDRRVDDHIDLGAEPPLPPCWTALMGNQRRCDAGALVLAQPTIEGGGAGSRRLGPRLHLRAAIVTLLDQGLNHGETRLRLLPVRLGDVLRVALSCWCVPWGSEGVCRAQVGE